MKYNFQTICYSNLLKDLPERQKDVLTRRFGLRGEKETLESIGRKCGITRERVRQIEEDGRKELQIRLEDPQCQTVFRSFEKELEKAGFLKREDLLLKQLGGDKFQNHALFLLTLGKPFQRVGENEEFYAYWVVDKEASNLARKHISVFTSALKKEKKPISLLSNIPVSHIEISKNILLGPEGLYGLKDWPEVNPKGIKDRAYLVFKKVQQPLHFSQVAQKIGKDALPQTVHNELIKDPRFVLVGRGLYALGEWGYTPGIVREVIADVLKSSKKPMPKEQVTKAVLEQRQVKPNTILLNLQNKRYFIKDSEGNYALKTQLS